jgi:anti-sigma factor RsiW
MNYLQRPEQSKSHHIEGSALDWQTLCGQITALLPAYGAGVASDDEARLVEAALPFCPDAQAVVADYRAIGDSLLFIAPGNEAAPPIERLFQRIAQTEDQPASPLRSAPLPALEIVPRQMPKPVPEITPPQPRSSRGLIRSLTPLLAACAAVAVVLVGVMNYWNAEMERLRRDQAMILDALVTLSENDSQLATLIQASETAPPPVIAAQETQRRQLIANGEVPALVGSGAHADFIWNDGEGIGTLRVEGLPPLPSGQIYQLWLVREGHSLSLGTFALDADGVGVLAFDAPEPIGNFSHIGVSTEPTGGSPEPTTPHLVIGEV